MARPALFSTIFLLILFLLPGMASAQKDRVEIIPQILTRELADTCRGLEPGKIIFYYEPEYPPLARVGRIGGTVNVTIRVGVSGNSEEILNISGNPAFLEVGTKAARKVKFGPTLCDGRTIPVTALMTYNFIPEIETKEYFLPEDVSGFTDLRTDSPYFGSISDLTDTYRICFGYSDKQFHENAPLTRGDFAEFLRLTLDLLFKRAQAARKIPAEIGLMRPFNPQKLTSVNSFKDLKKNDPFYRSVGILLQTYDIAFVEEGLEFQGDLPITRNEVIDLWTNIFTKEAVPIHFEKVRNGDQIFSRGEFALYLQESMRVLTYKTLP